MRTNIDIDDRLMRQAMSSSRSRTKRAAVEEGLRPLIQTHAQAHRPLASRQGNPPRLLSQLSLMVYDWTRSKRRLVDGASQEIKQSAIR